MKIAIVSAFMFDQTVGGVENHIRFMSKALAEEGNEIRLFSPVASRAKGAVALVLRDELEVVKIPVPAPPPGLEVRSGRGVLGLGAAFLTKLSFAFHAGPVIEAIEAWNPEVVWQHDFVSSWRTTKRLSRRYPVVLTNHTGEYLALKRFGPVGDALLSSLLRHYSAVIGPSRELTPTSGPPAYTVPNGVDTKNFFPLEAAERARVRQRLYGADPRFIILCPRRWAPTKGVLPFVQALRELDQTEDIRDSIAVVFAGDAHPGYRRYVAEVEESLKGLRLPVIRLGKPDVYELIPYYQTADLVVIPSFMEAVSLAALEAMACEAPVLSTRVGGMPDLISDGDTGYLIEKPSPAPLAQALLRCRDDPERSAIAARGSGLVRGAYGWDTQARRVEQILSTVVRRRNAA